MGDVRTERMCFGDIEFPRFTLVHRPCSCVPECPHEISSLQTSDQGMWVQTVTLYRLLASVRARAEQAESTIAAWKKDAEDKAVLIAELMGQLKRADTVAFDAAMKPEWISVKDGLPPHRVTVMVYTVGLYDPDGIRMASYDETQPASMFWHGIIMGHRRGVTHWRPLPTPPGAVHETKGASLSRSTDLEREDKNECR